MKRVFKCILLAAVQLFLLTSCSMLTHMPLKDSLPVLSKLPIDGTWKRSDGAVFRIEQGRMYFYQNIQNPNITYGMCPYKNITHIGAGRYACQSFVYNDSTLVRSFAHAMIQIASPTTISVKTEAELMTGYKGGTSILTKARLDNEKWFLQDYELSKKNKPLPNTMLSYMPMKEYVLSYDTSEIDGLWKHEKGAVHMIEKGKMYTYDNYNAALLREGMVTIKNIKSIGHGGYSCNEFLYNDTSRKAVFGQTRFTLTSPSTIVAVTQPETYIGYKGGTDTYTRVPFYAKKTGAVKSPVTFPVDPASMLKSIIGEKTGKAVPAKAVVTKKPEPVVKKPEPVVKKAESKAGKGQSIRGKRWAVIVGISDYADSRIPALRYASADAQAFNDWLVSPRGGRYAPSQVTLLTDEKATSRNIKNALFVWLKQAIEEDVVIVYFAGHGSPEAPDSPDNLFLLTHDTDYSNIASTAFPMWDVETALTRFIKAKKVIVLADACHSGGVGSQFDVARRSNRGLKSNSISSGIQNLSQVADGVCVISASDDKQMSQESKEWGGGHGVFTYYLLKGLQGEADYTKDSQVTLGELTSYLSEEVRRATRNAQSPTVAGKYDPALAVKK